MASEIKDIFFNPDKSALNTHKTFDESETVEIKLKVKDLLSNVENIRQGKYGFMHGVSNVNSIYEELVKYNLPKNYLVNLSAIINEAKKKECLNG